MEWINIHDKVPETNQFVLLFTKYSKYQFCCSVYNGIDFINTDEYGSKVYNVEYWMLLPEPPETILK